ncbi:unnamed protein product [Pedinophyceae sp. YPF-701]|nr:unnamed protein product [Pedinophyceae sp. YPF-701]
MCDPPGPAASNGEDSGTGAILPPDVWRRILDRLAPDDITSLASCCVGATLIVLRCRRRLWMGNCPTCFKYTILDLAYKARELGIASEDLPCVMITEGIGATLFGHAALQLYRCGHNNTLKHVAQRGLQHVVEELHLGAQEDVFPIPEGMTGLRVLSHRAYIRMGVPKATWLPPSSAQHVRMLRLALYGSLSERKYPICCEIPEGLTSLEWIELRNCCLVRGDWLPESSRKRVRCLELRGVQLLDGIPEDMQALELIVAERCDLRKLPPEWTFTTPFRHAALLNSKPVGPYPLTPLYGRADRVELYARASPLQATTNTHAWLWSPPW